MDISFIFKNRHVWTFSNFLSFLRLILGIFLYFLLIDRQTLPAIFIGIIAIISDYADGYIARKRNEVSDLGKILDPLADKVAVGLSSIALHSAFGMPLWIVLLIIGRDILILMGSLILMGKVEQVIQAELPGKIAVTVVAGLLLTYLFQLDFLKIYFIVLSVAAIALSFSFYFYKFVRMVHNKTVKQEKL
ncbi:MAG: CDP-alcohol phosphatidyltransferase family protein [Calditrichia bacterium]